MEKGPAGAVATEGHVLDWSSEDSPQQVLHPGDTAPTADQGHPRGRLTLPPNRERVKGCTPSRPLFPGFAPAEAAATGSVPARELGRTARTRACRVPTPGERLASRRHPVPPRRAVPLLAAWGWGRLTDWPRRAAAAASGQLADRLLVELDLRAQTVAERGPHHTKALDDQSRPCRHAQEVVVPADIVELIVATAQ
jgi:hypothetical protein